MATCRRYGARLLRSRRINTDGYLAEETRTSPRLLAERRRRLHLGPADAVGSTAERDLLEEEREDNGERSDDGSDQDDVVARRCQGSADRDENCRCDLLL